VEQKKGLGCIPPGCLIIIVLALVGYCALGYELHTVGGGEIDNAPVLARINAFMTSEKKDLLPIPDYSGSGTTASINPGAPAQPPEPGPLEPGNPFYENATIVLVLVVGVRILWHLLGGTETPADDAMEKYG
jgi:hypothetical protein